MSFIRNIWVIVKKNKKTKSENKQTNDMYGTWKLGNQGFKDLTFTTAFFFVELVGLLVLLIRCIFLSILLHVYYK